MQQITPEIITRYMEENIPEFYHNRIEKLKKFELKTELGSKNPYFFQVENILVAGEFVKTILDAYLSSHEETLFDGFLEGLAVYVCQYVYGGNKSSAEGIDLEFEKNDTRYIVSIKSGPNWGNSSQIKKMKDNFRKAKKILGTNTASSPNVVAVNGCCYGRDNVPDKGEYLKLCGQRFWYFISGNEKLYTEIIKPLGHNAKDKNELFLEEYARVVNKFSLEFMEMFCDEEGNILWEQVIRFNSGKA